MSSKKSKNPNEQVHVIQDVDGKPLIVEDFYNDLVLVFFGDNKHSLQELLERLKEQDPTFRETTRGEAENPNANSDDGGEDANNSNSQTADDVKNYLKSHVHQAATFIYLNPAAVEWLVNHPDALEQMYSVEYHHYYLPDELAKLINKPELSYENRQKGSSSEKSSVDIVEKASKKPLSTKSAKERIPKFTKIGRLANDPLLVPSDSEKAEETAKIKGLRENLKSIFSGINNAIERLRNPNNALTRELDWRAIGSNLTQYRNTRDDLKKELANLNKGRGSLPPSFGTYWEHRNEFLRGELDPHDFWNLPREQAENINKAAENYYSQIKGTRIDPEVLEQKGEPFELSESFYHPIDHSVGDAANIKTPFVNGLPKTFGGLAHFANKQGYLNNPDDPFFTKLVANQFGLSEDAANDFTRQFAAIDVNDRMFLTSPSRTDDERFFKRFESANGETTRTNPNRVGVIPEYDPKNAIFKQVFGKKGGDEFQRNAANTLLSLMIDAPGASQDYILEQAQEINPNIDAKTYANVYKKVFGYLSDKKIIEPDAFRGGAGKEIVDANLRAQKIRGMSDDEKLDEYDRLVNLGAIFDNPTFDDAQKLAEINKRANATFAETEEAIKLGLVHFPFSNAAYSFVNPGLVGSGLDTNVPPTQETVNPSSDATTTKSSQQSSASAEVDDAELDFVKLANPYFQRHSTNSAQVQSASEALLKVMLQNPGASMEFSVEQAQKLEPTIGKGIFNAPYHNLRRFLFEKGVITPDMNDFESQRIVDANLRAKEMLNWSDDEKIAEYDRLVANGQIEERKGGKASLWDRVFSSNSEYNKKKRQYTQQREEQQSLVSSLEEWLNGESDPASREEYAKQLKEARAKLKEIDLALEKIKEGFVEWVPNVEKISLVTKQLEKTIKETDDAIKQNGAADTKKIFSTDTQRIIDASGAKEAVFAEAENSREKSEREKRWENSREAILENVLKQYPDAYKRFKRGENPFGEREAKWTYRGAEYGESIGRAGGWLKGLVTGSFSGAAEGWKTNAAGGFASAARGMFSGAARGAATGAATTAASGAASGAAAGAGMVATAFAVLGPIAVVIGAITIVTTALKKLYRATNQAAEKMMQFGQYDATLFAANLMHQGREFRRNIRFAQGTSQSGFDLIQSLDSFKDEALPILIAWQNLKNQFFRDFLDQIKPFADILSDIVEIFSKINKTLNNIPVLGDVKKVLTESYEDSQKGTKIEQVVGAASEAMYHPIRYAARLSSKTYRTFRDYDTPEAREARRRRAEEQEAERQERQRNAEFRERQMHGVRPGDFDPKSGDFTAYDVEGRQLSKKEQARDRTSELKFILRRRITADQVREDAELRHALANYQVAVNNYARGKWFSQLDIDRANVGRGLAGKLDAAAGIVNGETVTKESQLKLQQIALDGGASVREAGAQLEKKGKLAKTFIDTGEIDEEQIRQMHKITVFHNVDYYRKKYEQEFTENKMEAEAAAKYAEIKDSSTSLGVKNDDMTEILTTLRGSLACQQLTNERLASIVSNTRDTAENTENKGENEKKEHDFIFKFMESEAKRPIDVPKGFERSQYGRFAGEPREKKTGRAWGLRQRQNDANDDGGDGK